VQLPATSSLIASANGSSKFSKQKSRERKKEIMAPSSPQQQQQQRQAAPLLFEILPLEELPCRRVRLFFTDERVLHHTTDEREKEMNETANYFHNALAKESTRIHAATCKASICPS
jgi:hypothetical protein